MKIAFIVSCLESGQDGVGDYTRRLATECIRQGHPCIIVGLNDSHISETMFATQAMEGTPVSVLRMPSVVSWNERVTTARNWVDAFNPDWISLQFVPFGFHPKGLCFGIGKTLASINSKAPRHIMFHELWIGVSKTSPWRHRATGFLQRICIRQLIKILKPRMVHTSIRVYQAMLAQINVKSRLLPLFGNIPVSKNNHYAPSLREFISTNIFKDTQRSDFYVGLMFGTIHTNWQPQLIISKLSELANQQGRTLAIISIGFTGTLGNSIWNQMQLHFPDVTFIKLGRQPVNVISYVLQLADFGISTAPVELIGKSGTVAAMLEHYLPVIAVGDTIDFRFSYDHSNNDIRIASIFDQGFSLKRFLNSNKKKQSVEQSSVAETFLNSIEYAE